MWRIVKITAISLLTLVFCLFRLLVIAVVFPQHPALKIEQSGNSAIVHFETLAEYPSDVSRIKIVDDSSGLPIFEIRANGKRFQARKFKLSQGVNSTKLVTVTWGSYRVVTPTSDDHFQIKSGVQYSVWIWGGEWISTHETIRF
jgi:hypothetical protein